MVNYRNKLTFSNNDRCQFSDFHGILVLVSIDAEDATQMPPRRGWDLWVLNMLHRCRPYSLDL